MNDSLAMVFASLALVFANIVLVMGNVRRRRQEQNQDTNTELYQDLVTDKALAKAPASLGKTIGVIVAILLIIVPTCIYTVQYLTPSHTQVSDDDFDLPIHKDMAGAGIRTESYFTNDMDSGKSSGILDLTNPKGNQYLEQAELTDATGKVLYTSPMLRPGQSIKTVTLSTTLAQGYHDVTVHFVLYDMTSLCKAGQINFRTRITAK